MSKRRRTSKTRSVQRALNSFTRYYLRGLGPLLVDGRNGQHTLGRVKTVKFYLGYLRENCDNSIDAEFLWRLAHPRTHGRAGTKGKYDRKRVERSKHRCIKQRAKHNHHDRNRSSGVGKFDGVLCANWLIPYHQWARQHGWRGRLVSGWRDPVYSQGLCYRMCGRPSCPGKCAGLASNHVGSVKPKGASDVTDYINYGQIIRRCPFSPRIYNALGARDPVHFSASGR